MELTASNIEGFSQSILFANYDEPKPTPDFHRVLWEMCCSDKRQIAVAAPRNHAKSTAVTHAYTLAAALFRQHRYIIIISDTEDQAVEFLGDIKNELLNNEVLIQNFSILKLLKDAQTEIVCQMKDGYKFRIIAKGSEQKIRGRKWLGMRPSLIVCDDLENEEAVANADRREKFRRWFFSAAKQSLRDSGAIRVVGTILHEDSLLNRLMKNRVWTSKLFKAHKGFDDFSDILWEEKFPEERLREIRQEFIEDGFSEGYSAEYLNDPYDHASSYFKREDFIPMTKEDHTRRKVYYCSADLAISKAERADWTVMAAIGVDDEGIIHVVDIRRERMDSLEIIEEFFSLQQRYKPDLFGVEKGQIEKSIAPFLNAEMLKRGIFISLKKLLPTKDKPTRARSLQARLRAGSVRFDTEAEWYPALEEEMLRFPKGTHDDQTDALAWIGLMLDDIVEAQTDEEYYEDEYNEEFGGFFAGRNAVTGY